MQNKPLVCSIGCPCSHWLFRFFPFHTPTKPLLRFHIRYKVRNRTKIRNRYNLTQDTNGKVTNSQLDIINESQEVSPFPMGDHKVSINSPFPTGDHKAPINRNARKHNKHKTEIRLVIHKRSTALENCFVSYITNNFNIFKYLYKCKFK